MYENAPVGVTVVATNKPMEAAVVTYNETGSYLVNVVLTSMIM